MHDEDGTYFYASPRTPCHFVLVQLLHGGEEGANFCSAQANIRIGRDGTRVQVIAKYRRWLWEQINLKNEAYDELRRIAGLARQCDITLVCWCAPELCHATVIERSVEYLNSTGAVEKEIL